MRQRNVGDCWFLAAAGAVAKNDPQWIRDHVWQNPDGTWTAKMFKDGESVYIQVEPTVPERAASDAHGKDGIEAITGQPIKSTGESNFDDISERLKNDPVTVGTKTDPNGAWFFQHRVDHNHAVPNPEYIVDSVAEHINPETGESQRMIHLLNPWGPDGGNLDGDTPTRWAKPALGRFVADRKGIQAELRLGCFRYRAQEIGEHHGNHQRKTRLAAGDQTMTLTETESMAVPGHGLLTLEHVSTEGKGSVTISLHDAE
ncbi:hypothetical protein [Arthrobacter alpinus]|uniref:hypothetical protein n=1 Tax=Arthrobacter alpinus TaxID=656366 RepID=UPI0016483BE1|nr:hypothetical protein [Arthrobacter alpinus]